MKGFHAQQPVLFMTIVVMCLSACEREVSSHPTSTMRPAIATPTFTPTVTPFPPLPEDGPYLMTRPDFDSQVFRIYGVGGVGRKVVELPSSPGYFGSSARFTSPDGQWWVFYSGNLRGYQQEPKLPLTLSIMNIGTGKVVKIADVVTNGYEEKLEEVISKFRSSDPDLYAPVEGLDWLANGVASEFHRGINSIAWSPDGHYLAYPAQIDGISSDVYVYDMETSSIYRANDDDQNVLDIEWSPDGNYIVFRNSTPDHVYSYSSIHFVRADGQTVKNPKPIGYESVENMGWVSNELLMTNGGIIDGAGDTGLDLVNADTKETVSIWPGFYGDAAADVNNKIVAVTTSYNVYVEQPGIYFFDYQGRQKKYIEGQFFNLLSRRGDRNSFLAMHAPEQGQTEYVAIASDGTVTPLNYLLEYYVSISPDGTWLVIYNKSELDLYNAQDQLIEMFQIPGLSGVTWRPDSKGLYYDTFVDGSELYYMSIPDGSTLFVDKCTEEHCSFSLDDSDSVWLP